MFSFEEEKVRVPPAEVSGAWMLALLGTVAEAVPPKAVLSGGGAALSAVGGELVSTQLMVLDRLADSSAAALERKIRFVDMADSCVVMQNDGE